MLTVRGRVKAAGRQRHFDVQVWTASPQPSLPSACPSAPYILMANPPRRIPPPTSQQEYYAVPQSPRSTGHGVTNNMSQPYGPRPPNRSSSTGSTSQMRPSRGPIAQGVATGAIGNAYGPYSVRLWSFAMFDTVIDLRSVSSSI